MVILHDGFITVDEPADKVNVSKGNNSVYYDLNGPADIPLAFGNGKYTLKFYRQKIGNHYILLNTKTLSADNTSEYMLHANCYIPEVPVAWDYAKLICRDKTKKASYKTIINWANRTIVYDFVKAVIVAPQKGVMPDPQAVWEKHRGICQDTSSLIVGMLRSVGVPSRMVVGRADGKLHAWVEAVIDGKTYRWDSCGTKVKTYTKERWY